MSRPILKEILTGNTLGKIRKWSRVEALRYKKMKKRKTLNMWINFLSKHESYKILIFDRSSKYREIETQ